MKKTRNKKANKDLRRAKSQATKLKNIVYEHYGNKCTCCKESNKLFLTIEHLSGGGRKHRELVGRGIQFLKWIIKNEFPDNLTLLCFNCNQGKARNNGICPHKGKN